MTISRKVTKPSNTIQKEETANDEIEKDTIESKIHYYDRVFDLNQVTESIDWHAKNGFNLIQVVTHVSGTMGSQSSHLIIFEGNPNHKLLERREAELFKNRHNF